MDLLTNIGFLVSTLGYMVLLLLLFTVRKAGLAKYLLIFATLITCSWSSLSLWVNPFDTDIMLLADSIKQWAWALFLAACLKQDFSSLTQVMKRVETWAILAMPSVAIVLPYLLPLAQTWSFLLQTVIALEMLLLLELIFRQAGEDTWAYKPLIIYLGVTNLYEFVSYANATMIAQYEPLYFVAKGYLYAAFLPFLVLAIRRIRHWGVEIFVSRDVVLHSSLMLVAGAYLFLMATVGYVVKLIGGQWTSSIQLGLILSSLIILVTLFVSDAVRNRFKVFITKHFFANQFDYRVEWLKLTRALKSDVTERPLIYQQALNAFLHAMDYKHGALLKLRNARTESVAQIGEPVFGPDDASLVVEICAFCQRKNWIVDAEELRTRPYVYEGLKINPQQLTGIRFQLALPIYQDEQLWGLVLLRSGEGKGRGLNWELRDYLNAVTAQISNYVFHHEASLELAENAQFSAFNRMSAFVLHDLKNVLAQIDLILANAQQHKHNPEFIEDTFETLQHTKSRMEKMLRQLTEKKEAEDQQVSLCSLSAIIEEVVNQKCATLLPKPEILLNQEQKVEVDKEKFANVVYHLVSNAQQATADLGWVRIHIDLQSDYLLVKIADSGTGMSQEFIANRLFKPFDTTKGNAGMGIGAYDAKSYMEQIGGHLEVESVEGKGSVFTLYIPLEKR